MRRGFCLGRFDLLHHGHIQLFKLGKKNCDHLIVGIMYQPFKSLENKKQVFLPEERKEIISAIRYVDEVVMFSEENEVFKWLEINKPDILVTGEEYRNNQPLSKYFKQENIIYSKEKARSSEIKDKIKNWI